MTNELNNIQGQQKYPISEIFTSPQGEGVYAGVLMTFIRLAGCTVGKPYPDAKYKVLPHCKFECDGGDPDMGHGPNCKYAKSTYAFPIYTEKCTLFDGREFPCDTDYRVKERMTPYQIIQEIPKNVKHVCITGGEPLMHNLDNLFSYLWGEYKDIHIETSGTIYKEMKPDIWVTVSPKFNVQFDMIMRANEIKILVDKDFDPEKRMSTLIDGGIQYVKLHDLAASQVVYIQPVNFENEVNKENLQRCLDLQQDYPNFRISCQLHKVFSQQTGELVR